MLSRLRDSEDGFTLVELMIAIVIMAVITVPLANVVIGVLHNQGDTADRLALSHDGQISSSYFAQDVASTGIRDYDAIPGAGGDLPFHPSVQLAAAYNSGGKTCGTATTPTATVRFLSDDWDNAASPAAVHTDIVAYYLKSAGAVSELHRIRCAGSATPTSDLVVAHNVNPATVTVTCDTQCDAAAVPQRVTLSFSVTKPTVGKYDISLTGQRRQT
jgi:prepilin-type N-terminal cleavage/methylation domain-containing protein